VHPPAHARLLGVLVLAAGTTTACSSSEASSADRVATAFSTAVTASEGADACALLAPKTKSEVEQSAGKACPDALLGENLPRAGGLMSTDAYGTMAKVTFRADTMFLARFKGGWRVMAAGCSPKSGHPYECTVSGG
jgi:hypothetical protein